MFNEDTAWPSDLRLSFPMRQTLTIKLLKQIREYLCCRFVFTHLVVYKKVILCCVWSVFNSQPVIPAIIVVVYCTTRLIHKCISYWIIYSLSEGFLFQLVQYSLFATCDAAPLLSFLKGGSAGYSQPADNLKSHFNPTFWWLISTLCQKYQIPPFLPI